MEPNPYQISLADKVRDNWKEVEQGKLSDYREYLEKTERRDRVRKKDFVDSVVAAKRAGFSWNTLAVWGCVSRSTLLKYAGEELAKVERGEA